MRIRARFWPVVLLWGAAVAVSVQAQTQPARKPPPAAPPATLPTVPATTQPATKSAGTPHTKAPPQPKPARLDQPEGKAPVQPPAVRLAEPKAVKSSEPQAAKAEQPATAETTSSAPAEHAAGGLDFMSMVFVFMLATFIGIGVIRRVSRLLHTPLMSLTNAISAIAVVGSIMLAGGREYPVGYKIVGAVAIFASMTNIISGFLITDRMLKMFKSREGGKA